MVGQGFTTKLGMVPGGTPPGRKALELQWPPRCPATLGLKLLKLSLGWELLSSVTRCLSTSFCYIQFVSSRYESRMIIEKRWSFHWATRFTEFFAYHCHGFCGAAYQVQPLAGLSHSEISGFGGNMASGRLVGMVCGMLLMMVLGRRARRCWWSHGWGKHLRGDELWIFINREWISHIFPSN